MNKSWFCLGVAFGNAVVLALGCGQTGDGTPGSGGAAAAGSTTTAASSSASSSSSGSGTSSSGTGDSSSNATSTSGSGGSGGGVTCKTPGTLHPPKADAGTNTIYCPFSAVDGGMNLYCDHSAEHCCEPTMAGTPSDCQPAATPCAMGDTDWACEDPGDCPGGQVCCGAGTLVINPDPSCANYAKKFHGTHCADACLATEIKLCTSDAECANQTCVPFSSKGNQVGGCH